MILDIHGHSVQEGYRYWLSGDDSDLQARSRDETSGSLRSCSII